jgi:hypothetical protein
MSPLWGTKSLPSNMGIMNEIKEVGKVSSSLKLNILLGFVSIVHFHPNLGLTFKTIMGYSYYYVP